MMRSWSFSGPVRVTQVVVVTRPLQPTFAKVAARLTPSSTTVTCLLAAAGGDAEDVALGLVRGLLMKAGVQSKE